MKKEKRGRKIIQYRVSLDFMLGETPTIDKIVKLYNDGQLGYEEAVKHIEKELGDKWLEEKNKPV